MGHFRQVCRKPKRTKDARTNLVKVEEAHGGGTRMMRGVKVTPTDGGTPFVPGYQMYSDIGVGRCGVPSRFGGQHPSA